MRCGGGGLAVGPVVEDDCDDVAGEAEGHPHDQRLQQEHARLVQRRHGHVSGAASLCPARAALSEVGAQVHADLARAPLPPSGPRPLVLVHLIVLILLFTVPQTVLEREKRSGRRRRRLHHHLLFPGAPSLRDAPDGGIGVDGGADSLSPFP